MKQYNTCQSRKGFTLIELLVVVGVVAVLATAAMVIINPSEQLQKSRDTQRKQDLRQLQVALQAYYEDNGRFPLASSQQIQEALWGSEWRPYMAKVPKDPLSAQSYLYETDANGTYYRVYAKLEKCSDPQMIPGANCADYNYAITSSNIVAALFSTPTPIPTPTSTPIPPTPTPTPTPRPFKWVFVTSTRSNGHLVSYVETDIDSDFTGDGLTAGDRICKWRADNAQPNPLGGTWTAWLSTSAENAVDRVYPPGAGKDNTEYRLVDGETVVANNKTDLTTDDGDGNWIKNPINRNENNVQTINEWVWTGTKSDGTYNIDRGQLNGSCISWRHGDRPVTGAIGDSDVKSSSWTFDTLTGFVSCDIRLSLYCFEQ